MKILSAIKINYISVLLFIILFIIYTNGVSASVFGGDSGDIILASWFGGVAHPPGYPLNTMIGWIFTHLPYSASVAFKANLMAAFMMAGTCAFLFLIIEKLIKNKPIAVVATLVFAFNPLIWLYAHVIEVFQLNLLLVALSVYFLLDWREKFVRKAKVAEKGLLLTVLFFGFAFFHHQTSILLAPAYFYLILKTDRHLLRPIYILKLFLIFCIGILPYIFIPLAAAQKTPINWGDATSVGRFLQLITRADYGSFLASAHLVGQDPGARLSQLKEFFLFTKSDFTFAGLVLLVLGASYCFLRERKILYFILIAISLTGPFFLFYASFPLENEFFAGLWERFVLLPYLFITIFVGYGLFFINSTLVNLIKQIIPLKIVGKRTQKILSVGILAIFPFYLLLTNFPKADLSKFKLGDWFGQDVLASADPNAIVFVFGDTLTFNSQYVFYTGANTERIKLILAGQLRHKYYREHVLSSYPELSFPENFLNLSSADSTEPFLSLIQSNLGKQPIFSTGYYPPIEGSRWMKVGLLKRLVKNDEYNKHLIVSANESAFKDLNYSDFQESLGYGHFVNIDIQSHYYDSIIELSDELIDLEAKMEAKVYLNSAIKFLPDRKEAYVRLGNIAIQGEECNDARDNFEKAFTIDGRDWRLPEVLATVYKDCFDDIAKSDEYLGISKYLKDKFILQDKI